MHQLLFTVFVTGVCFFNCAGSEEHVSELKGTHHKRNTDTHEAYYHTGVESYHNQEGYGPPHHNHDGYHQPGAEPRSYSGSNADSWNDYQTRQRIPQHNPFNTPQDIFPRQRIPQRNPFTTPHDYQTRQRIPQHNPFNTSPDHDSSNCESCGDDRNGRNNQKSEAVTTKYANNSAKEIPRDFLEKLDMYDVDDILLNYIDGYEDDDQTPLFSSRFGSDTQERSKLGKKAGHIPAKAGCKPENTTVPLVNSDDPSILYIPKCTRIERCNGCCSHRLLACQPVEIETISVQVIKAQYTGDKKMRYVSKELIPLERHLKCKCDCKVRAEHCLPNQVYRKDECDCICTNTDEENKCYRDYEKKEWDIDTCSCKCRGVYECSTGSVYDHNECRCKTAPKRRYAALERRAHNREKQHVDPLDL
ncbi:unnamed protein product [Diabrotica balteata]|uniref:Platelet-derived growth factor (PDGF) family profile domain-containing protein n=1 Tax=Diabrotica balteata TaxID=107213 RepID=A0A9N9T1D5_DIABA|nr:unnamed protein product [Diabrotica balteata]